VRTFASNQVKIGSTTLQTVLAVDDAQYADRWAVRISGQGIDWQVVADGPFGREVIDSGTIAAGAVTFARATVPSPLGATRLLVQAALTSAGAARLVGAEANWTLQPANPVGPVLSGHRRP